MIVVIVVDCFVDLSNGTAVSANNLAKELEIKGHEVRVVAPYAKGFGVKERYIPIVDYFAKKQHFHFGLAQSEVLQSAFRGADIIHFFLPFKLEIVGIKIAQKMKIPYLGAFHLQPEHISRNGHLGFIPKIDDFILWLFKTRFYDKLPYIHCPSQFIYDYLKAKNFKNNLFVISNGFKASFSKKHAKKRDDYFHICATSRYAQEKRMDVLIEAVKISKYEKHIKLHLKGQGPLENELKNRAKQLSNEVDFGFVSHEELGALYQYMDLFVHCADVDGEAISVLEAIACGIVPIISDSNLAAPKQFALDNRSLFKAGDARDLAEKIDYFLEHKEILDDLGKSYADSAKSYDLSICVDKMIEKYEEIIKNFKG